MADNYATIQSVKFYEFEKNSYRIGIVYNKQLEKYSIKHTAHA